MFHDRFQKAELDRQSLVRRKTFVLSELFAEDKSFRNAYSQYFSHRTLFNYSKQKSNHLGIINSVRFIIREVKVRKNKKNAYQRKESTNVSARQNAYQAASLHYVVPRLERGIWVLPKYDRNCQRIHPKKQALETIRHIGKKRRL